LAAGCSRTLYYKHFKGKEDILDAVIDNQYRWWKGHIEALGSEFAVDEIGVTRWLEAFVDRFAHNRGIMHLLMARGSAAKSMMEHNERVEAISVIEDSLDRLVGSPVDRDTRRRRLMMFILHAEWTCLTMALVDFGKDRELMLGDLAEVFLGVAASR
jgi:AcrR family transcriptional regulator